MSGAAALEAWLATGKAEPILDPALPIVDPHHHLWDRGGHRYLADELLADIRSGHDVIATGYVECLNAWLDHGPDALRPVGETAFVVAETAAHRDAGLCAAIVGHADLRLGERVEPVLEAHRAAGGGRFRGIRYATAWDAGDQLHGLYRTEPAMLARADLRAGIAALGRLGLTFDAWLYFPQLDELADAADACPDTTIILDHLGGTIGIGPYAGRRDELFVIWRDALARVAARPNVVVKLGGLGMALSGFGFRKHARPPGSAELAAAWRPYIETAIALFGADRAMFESNFPVDRTSGTYATLWNAFKRIAAGASADEKAALFSGTARRVYKIDA